MSILSGFRILSFTTLSFTDSLVPSGSGVFVTICELEQDRVELDLLLSSDGIVESLHSRHR